MRFRFLLFLGFFLMLENAFGQVKFNFLTDEHDFGTVEEGEVLNYSFDFTNSGKDTILLTEESRDVRPGCSCTASEYSKESIAPGSKGFIKAGYNTQGRVGQFLKNITVSQKGTPYKVLTIKGFVVRKGEKKVPTAAQLKKTPILVIDKKSHYFGKVEKNSELSVRFNVKNVGKDTLKILSYYSGCHCINFKLVDPKDFKNINYILQGKTAILEVIYKPIVPSELADNQQNDIFTLFLNDLKNPKVEINLTCNFEEQSGLKDPATDKNSVPLKNNK